jgi:hypothetical protein
MIELRTQFENAISDLRALLEQELNNEDKFQEWFEKNTIVMASLNYKKSIPHPTFKAYNDDIYIPDFIVLLLNNTWEIFELKLPYEKLLKDKVRRNTFYAKVYEYCQQCHEYSEFFADNTNRINFQKNYDFIIPSPPRSKIVIGRDNGLDRFELIKKIDQFSNPIDILTYDDILRQLEFDKLKVLGEYENVNGLAIHVVAKIIESNKPNYLFSFGSSGSNNNLSIYVNTSNQICYCLTDKDGKVIIETIDKSASKFEFGKSTYFVFEFGFGEDYTICSSEVNGNYGSVIRTTKMDFDLLDLKENFVIGSNYNGTENSEFELYEFVIWSKTFSLETRLAIRNNVIESFINNTEIPESRLLFYDNRFLYKNSNKKFKKNSDCNSGDMVQMENRNQPGLITKGVKKGELFVSVFYDQSK